MWHLVPGLRRRADGGADIPVCPGLPGKSAPASKITVHKDGSEIEAREGICAVSLRVISSEPFDAEQMALFSQALRAPEDLSLTLDRLRSRLG